MPSNNVFQYSKIQTRKRSAKKSIKSGKKKMESSSFWNPESTALESGIQYPESGIHSMESRIQDCPGFSYMGRMKYAHEIVGTHGGALLLGRAPGACSRSKIPRVQISLKLMTNCLLDVLPDQLQDIIVTDTDCLCLS